MMSAECVLAGRQSVSSRELRCHFRFLGDILSAEAPTGSGPCFRILASCVGHLSALSPHGTGRCPRSLPPAEVSRRPAHTYGLPNGTALPPTTRGHLINDAGLITNTTNFNCPLLAQVVCVTQILQVSPGIRLRAGNVFFTNTWKQPCRL